jgi:hypothetical protein
VNVTDHSAFDYAAPVERARLIADARNTLKGCDSRKMHGYEA